MFSDEKSIVFNQILDLFYIRDIKRHSLFVGLVWCSHFFINQEMFRRNISVLTTPKGKVIFMTLSDPYPSLRQIL